MKNTKKRGFTLIELIVVMAIIAILVLLASPRFLGYTKDAKVTAMKSDAKVLSNAALLYNIETEKFPVAFVDTNTNGIKDGAEVDAAAPVVGALLQAKLNAAVGGTFTNAVADLSATQLVPYVKSLNGAYADYILVLDGPLQGEVFHKTGIANKAGVIEYGIK